MDFFYLSGIESNHSTPPKVQYIFLVKYRIKANGLSSCYKAQLLSTVECTDCISAKG